MPETATQERQAAVADPGAAVTAEQRLRAHVETLERRLRKRDDQRRAMRSEEHTSELQSRVDLVCRLLLEKKKKKKKTKKKETWTKKVKKQNKKNRENEKEKETIR